MDRSVFTNEEWNVLRAAPFNVQFLVSQSDGDRELEEIHPLLEILMSYEGDPLLEDLFKDTMEATEEERLNIDTRVALDEVVNSVAILNKAAETSIIDISTVVEFKKLLISIAEQTAQIDLEGLEEQEESVIRLLKNKLSD